MVLSLRALSFRQISMRHELRVSKLLPQFTTLHENWIYTKFTQGKFGAKKCKLRLNKGQRS